MIQRVWACACSRLNFRHRIDRLISGIYTSRYIIESSCRYQKKCVKRAPSPRVCTLKRKLNGYLQRNNSFGPRLTLKSQAEMFSWNAAAFLKAWFATRQNSSWKSQAEMQLKCSFIWAWIATRQNSQLKLAGSNAAEIAPNMSQRVCACDPVSTLNFRHRTGRPNIRYLHIWGIESSCRYHKVRAKKEAEIRRLKCSWISAAFKPAKFGRKFCVCNMGKLSSCGLNVTAQMHLNLGLGLATRQNSQLKLAGLKMQLKLRQVSSEFELAHVVLAEFPPQNWPPIISWAAAV